MVEGWEEMEGGEVKGKRKWRHREGRGMRGREGREMEAMKEMKIEGGSRGEGEMVGMKIGLWLREGVEVEGREEWTVYDSVYHAVLSYLVFHHFKCWVRAERWKRIYIRTRCIQHTD